MDAAQQNLLNLQWKPTTLCGTTMAVDTVPLYISWWGNIQGKRSRKRRLRGKTDRGWTGCLRPWGSLHDLTLLVLTGPKRHPVLAKAKSLSHAGGASGKTFLRKCEELHWQRGVKGKKKCEKQQGRGCGGSRGSPGTRAGAFLWCQEETGWSWWMDAPWISLSTDLMILKVFSNQNDSTILFLLQHTKHYFGWNKRSLWK